MSICLFPSTVSAQCGDLQQELYFLVSLLHSVDQIKVGSGDHEPTWVELANLWEGELVPPAAMVFWYNSDTTTISWWVCPTGDYYEEL